MSTRGGVAVGTLDKWIGVFNRQDSYPMQLGVNVLNYLVGILRGKNESLKTLADYEERLLNFDTWMAFQTGDHSWDAKGRLWHINNQEADPIFIEWVYVLDAKKAILWVLESVNSKESTMMRVGRQKMAVPIMVWKPIAKIYLRLLIKIPLAKMNDAQIIDYIEEMMNQIEDLTRRGKCELPMQYPTDGESKNADQ